MRTSVISTVVCRSNADKSLPGSPQRERLPVAWTARCRTARQSRPAPADGSGESSYNQCAQTIREPL
jgi:hypothetical protein